MSVDRRTIIVRGLSRTNIASCFSITRSSSTRNTCGERASVAPSGANTNSILIRWVREPDGSLPTGYRRRAPLGPRAVVKSVNALFLQPKQTYSLGEAATLLGMDWRDMRGWVETGELEGVRRSG